MASGTLLGGGGDGSRDRHRWAESKVYTRKSHNKSSKPCADPASQSLPTAINASADDATSSQLPMSRVDAASDDSSSLNRPSNPPPSNGFLHNRVKIDLASRSKHDIRELRRKLTNELDQVRSLVRTLEARASQPDGGYSHPLPFNDGPKRERTSEVASAGPHISHRPLSVSVVENNSSDLAEKEKRTPKANQYYRNSDFVLGKDKFPPPDSNKKIKPNGSGHAVHDKFTVQAFKHCMNILMRLIKHRHGWVFDKPVDVKGLGLHDYYIIIKHPMDLGTVKTRLESNWYKSPQEFAEDVRLTFRNAMTYNPKGQDVHTMAEQLSKIFEDRWSVIELEYRGTSRYEVDHEVGPPPYPPKKSQPQAPVPETRPNLDRSESTTTPLDPKPAVHYTPSGRVAAPKKPKAKDPHKRDMTYEEKQKLSSNLMDLPPDKLDNIVQIIKKRNSALSQHDDEIEVDIDSFDAETLWELDRFVTNYKKSLSKNKRKAELAVQARSDAENSNIRLANSVATTADAPKDNKLDERHTSYLAPMQKEKQGNNASRSSSSSSSSSDSGSSSSDSDSESSSAGSDVGQSPQT